MSDTNESAKTEVAPSEMIEVVPSKSIEVAPSEQTEVAPPEESAEEVEVITRPRAVVFADSGAYTDLAGQPNLLDGESYDHLAFELHALGSFTSQIGEKTLPLPPKQHGKILRHARHTFLNVYRRLFTVVFILNFAVALPVLLIITKDFVKNPPLSNFASLAAANITLAILIRQEYIINSLYKTLWLVPLSLPLWFRKRVAKVYEFGGIHSGSAISSTFWFILLTVFLTIQFANKVLHDIAIITISYTLVLLLSLIVVTAYPMFRFKSHNTFEAVHRWAGWFSLALFWAELILFVRIETGITHQSFGIVLIQEPALWLLIITTFHSILPWLRLHKLYVNAEKPSDHVIRLHFEEPISLFVGMRISEHPLGEWHSFACIPNRDGGQSGGSLVVSNAGDWTKRNIHNPKPYYWIKGLPVTGVLCIAKVFKSVVIVTTGSGIGPCLGVMQDLPNTKVRVIWSTRDPWVTYGRDLCQSVLAVDPKACIIDTRFVKRPDLVNLANQIYYESKAEAVLVISNPKLTRKVVYGMESRGVPGFGPIWDS